MATHCIAQLTFDTRAPVAGRGPVRRAPRQLGRWARAAQGRRRPAGPDGGLAAACRIRGSRGRSSRADRPGPAACLRARRGYPDCNDAARLADDPLHKLVLDREPLTGPALAPSRRSRASRMASAGGALSGIGTGRDGHRPPPPAAPRPGAAHHDRSGPDRRSDARPAGAQLLQRPLRHVVLPATGRDPDLR